MTGVQTCALPISVSVDEVIEEVGDFPDRAPEPGEVPGFLDYFVYAYRDRDGDSLPRSEEAGILMVQLDVICTLKLKVPKILWLSKLPPFLLMKSPRSSRGLLAQNS